jgi:hypothetical protein
MFALNNTKTPVLYPRILPVHIYLVYLALSNLLHRFQHDQNQSILMLSVAPGAELDYEQQVELTLKLTVIDQAGNSNDIPVSIL